MEKKKMFKKVIIETVGLYMYIDPHNGQVIESDRPCVAVLTPYISQKIAEGVIELLISNLPMIASDKEFEAHLKSFGDAENGKNAAIASFASVFGIDENGNKVPGFVEPQKEKTDEEIMAELEAEEKEKATKAEEENKNSVLKNLFTKK